MPLTNLMTWKLPSTDQLLPPLQSHPISSTCNFSSKLLTRARQLPTSAQPIFLACVSGLTRGATAARSCSRRRLVRASRARRARLAVGSREASVARAVRGGVAPGWRGRSCHDAITSACRPCSKLLWICHLIGILRYSLIES